MYEYNQILLRKVRNRSNRIKLVKFIFYRPDLKTIVYDHEKILYQAKQKEFSAATGTDIYNFYENKINIIKKNIKANQRQLNIYKKRYKQYMTKVQDTEIEIKENNEKLFNYKIMNKIVNSNLCEHDIINTIKNIGLLINCKKSYHENYYLNLHESKLLIKSIKKMINEIGKYKQERNEILNKEVYIYED